jgi:hypothetical protein
MLAGFWSSTHYPRRLALKHCAPHTWTFDSDVEDVFLGPVAENALYVRAVSMIQRGVAVEGFSDADLLDVLERMEFDEELDFVFTLRMLPTLVRLRLMSRLGSSRQYLAIRNR